MSQKPELTSTKLITRNDLTSIPKWLLRRLTYWAPTPLLLWIARLEGYIEWRRRKRGWVLRLLRNTFGDTKSADDVSQVYRRHLEYLRQFRITRLWPQRSDFQRQISKAEVTGIKHLEAALARGNGAFLLTMHFGYGRLIKHFLRRLGYVSWDVGSVAENEEEQFSRFRDFFYRRLLRMPRFNRIEENDLSTELNIRPMIKVLQRNELINMAADGMNALQFVELPVFGHTMPIPVSVTKIAASTGAALLPAFVVDTDGNAAHPRLFIYEALQLTTEDGQPREPREVLSDLLQRFQSLADAYPHLYHWQRLRRPAEARRLRSSYLEEQASGQKAQPDSRYVPAHERSTESSATTPDSSR